LYAWASCRSGRRHTSFSRDWSSDVCSSDLGSIKLADLEGVELLAGRFGKSHLASERALDHGGGGIASLVRVEEDRDVPYLGEARSEERRAGKASGWGVCGAYCRERLERL